MKKPLLTWLIQHGPSIKEMPEANDPNDLLNEIMRQKGKPKKEEDERQKINVEALLDRIQSSILLD